VRLSKNARESRKVLVDSALHSPKIIASCKRPVSTPQGKFKDNKE
jgi:hypothetical protein